MSQEFWWWVDVKKVEGEPQAEPEIETEMCRVVKGSVDVEVKEICKEVV